MRQLHLHAMAASVNGPTVACTHPRDLARSELADFRW